jgi:hypothetical protein
VSNDRGRFDVSDFDAPSAVVRLPAADWRIYADGLRTLGDPVAVHLLPRIAAVASAEGETALVLSRVERAVLREIDQRAAESLMPRKAPPRHPPGRFRGLP